MSLFTAVAAWVAWYYGLVGLFVVFIGGPILLAGVIGFLLGGRRR